MKNHSDFTEGKILLPLIRFAMPVLFALLLQAMYGAADLLIVGQFGSAADVSAVSTGSQIIQSITSVIIGLAMGTTILLGQKIGQKKASEAGIVIGTSIWLFAIIATLLTFIMLFFADSFSMLMQAPIEAFDKTVSYVQICSLGLIFIASYNVLGSVFRGMGNSKTPLITVAIACLINIALDLLFVAGFHMQAAGAAIATVIAQGVSVILSLIIIRKQGLPFPFTLKNIAYHKTTIKSIIKLGLPIALQDGLVSISFLVIIAIVNSLGVILSAGVGVAEKLCIFIMLVPGAYMQSMSAFVAQNIGAKKYNRAKKAMIYGMISSLCVGIIMSYLSFFHGNIMASFFSNDINVILAAANYLKAYAIDTLLVSFLFCFIGYFNGCGNTTFVMLQGIIGAFCIRIPVSFLMSQLPPVTLFKVGLATPISTIIQIALCFVFFIWQEKKQKKSVISSNTTV